MLRTGLLVSLVGCILTGLTQCQMIEEQILIDTASKDAIDNAVIVEGQDSAPAGMSPIDSSPIESPPVNSAGLTIVNRKDVTITDPIQTVGMETKVLTPVKKVREELKTVDEANILPLEEPNTAIINTVDAIVKETRTPASQEGTQNDVNTVSNDTNNMPRTETIPETMPAMLEATAGETNTISDTINEPINDVVADLQAEINNFQSAIKDQDSVVSSEVASPQDSVTILKDQTNTPLTRTVGMVNPNNVDTLSQNEIDMKRAFIIPTNNVNSPRNTGSIGTISNRGRNNEDALAGNSQTGAAVDTNNMNVLQTTSSSTTTAAMTSQGDVIAAVVDDDIASKRSSLSASSTAASLPPPPSPTPVVAGSVVPSMVLSIQSSPSTDSSSSASSTPTVNDSTHGTVVPTSTKVGQTNTDDGTIVFRSSGNTGNQARSFTTTTVAVIDGAVSADSNNTTPQGNTTLNVIKPTTSRTTVIPQTENMVPTATLLNRIDTNTDKPSTQNMPVSPVTGDNLEVNMKSNGVTTKIIPSAAMITVKPSSNNSQTTLTTAGISKTTSQQIAENISQQTVDNEMNQSNGKAAILVAPTEETIVTSQQITENQSQSAMDSQMDQSNSRTIVAIPTKETIAVMSDGMCPNITCTGSCKHGRQQDTLGCETCECKFSADCPAPVQTTRLLCMMQMRMGQSCKTDAECPKHRICCPGSCGQSCHRRASGRSRVLTMLRGV